MQYVCGFVCMCGFSSRGTGTRPADGAEFGFMSAKLQVCAKGVIKRIEKVFFEGVFDVCLASKMRTHWLMDSKDRLESGCPQCL